jgi:hypothetical protein
MRNLLKDLLIAAVVGFLVLGAATVFTNRPPAVALSSSPTACITPKLWIQKSNAAAAVNVVATPASGAKITGISMSVETATGTWYAVVGILDATNHIQFGQMSVPLGAGYSPGVPNYNYLNQVTGLPLDSDGNPYILLTAAHTLYFAQGSSCVTCGGGNADKLQIAVIGCQFE